MVRRALILALAMLVAIASDAYADEWPQPIESGVISPDGQIAVLLTPGTSWGEVWGFAGSPVGQHARSRFFRLEGDERTYSLYQELELLNPVAPVFAAVSNDRALVTLDNWHNTGGRFDDGRRDLLPLRDGVRQMKGFWSLRRRRPS